MGTQKRTKSLAFGDAKQKLSDYKFKRVGELPRPLFSFNYSIIDDGRYDSHGMEMVSRSSERPAISRVKNSGEE
jgi:hypothetical protein